jgi:hypothetical protein
MNERKREKQYHSNTAHCCFVLFVIGLFIECKRSAFKNKQEWNKRKNREREQNGRYGIIRSINQLKEQTSKYSVACCCFFVCCVVGACQLFVKAIEKQQKHTKERKQ